MLVANLKSAARAIAASRAAALPRRSLEWGAPAVVVHCALVGRHVRTAVKQQPLVPARKLPCGTLVDMERCPISVNAKLGAMVDLCDSCDACLSLRQCAVEGGAGRAMMQVAGARS